MTTKLYSEYTCSHCGKIFTAKEDPKKKQRFCSKACSYKRVHAKKEVRYRTCTVCGKIFTVSQAQRKARICSDDCRRNLHINIAKKRTKRTERVCKQCGKIFSAPPCRIRQCCSRACMHLAQSGKGTRSIRTSSVVPCDYCGKPVKRYKSRAKMYQRTFCNDTCYHNWDSWYKSQPEQQRKHAERCMKMIECKTSKIEDDVARWLETHGIAHERQINLVRMSLDFKIGSAYIEVQGCYWHGCYQCFILQTPRQRKVMSRDKAKATYCRRRNIPLYTIWEHDIRAGNFFALEPLLQHAVPDPVG